MRTFGDAASDGLLVFRCLNGDQTAWERLYHQCQPGLLHLIRARLGGRSADADLIEEVASAVWSSLLDRDCSRLRRYDPSRGYRFLTYLAALARHEVRRLLRHRSSPGLPPELSVPPSDCSTETLLGEFLAILTPRERQFCKFHLLASETSTDPAAFSQANVWQLRHRVHQKLKNFAQIE